MHTWIAGKSRGNPDLCHTHGRGIQVLQVQSEESIHPAPSPSSGRWSQGFICPRNEREDPELTAAMWEWVLGQVIMAQVWKEDGLMILIVSIAIH